VRICFVTTNFPRYLGDSEGTFVWEAAKAISNEGHQVRVIAQHWPGIPTYEWIEDIEIIRPRYWWPESGERLRREGGGLPSVWQESWVARLQIIPFILIHTLTIAYHARDCDIIHAQWTLSAGTSLLSKMVHRCPILATLQGSDIFHVTRHQIGAWITKSVLTYCDRISALSQALAIATSKLGIPQSDIIIIPNGVDLSQFIPQPDSRTPTLLYVGSLIERKGISFLLRAMSIIMQKHPTLRLVIVGNGPNESHLKKLTADLNLTEYVTFTGSLPPCEVQQLMKQAKVFILPSVEEGLGVVLLEALACGTPIVASKVGGIPDVVTPEVGILVSPADPLSLASGITSLLDDEQLWGKMSKKARIRAETNYDWQQIAKKYIKIYQEMYINYNNLS